MSIPLIIYCAGAAFTILALGFASGYSEKLYEEVIADGSPFSVLVVFFWPLVAAGAVAAILLHRMYLLGKSFRARQMRQKIPKAQVHTDMG